MRNSQTSCDAARNRRCPASRAPCACPGISRVEHVRLAKSKTEGGHVECARFCVPLRCPTNYTYIHACMRLCTASLVVVYCA